MTSLLVNPALVKFKYKDELSKNVVGLLYDCVGTIFISKIVKSQIY